MAIPTLTDSSLSLIEPDLTYIETFHFETIAFIKEKADNALRTMHARADDVLRALQVQHVEAMDELVCIEMAFECDQDFEDLLHLINETIAPFKSIDDWFDNLPDMDKRKYFNLLFEYDVNNSEVERFDFEIIQMLKRRFRNQS